MSWTYDKQKALVAANNRDASREGRDIGPLPKVKNPKRRKSCARNFKLFCETYYPQVFNLAWSSDHLTVIHKIEDAVLNGGLFAIAMPRGSGKTSLVLAASEWSLLYGHRSFVVLIGASEDAACELLDHIKSDFETNDLLAADFPEVCHPVRKLDGIVHRAKGQLLNGERTLIGWTAKELVLPTIKGSCSSGARVKVAGITGRVRGLLVKQDGASIRPDFVLIDDPQTDESATSPIQVRKRMNTVSGAILGLAGPKKKIAGVMPVTVIAKGDVADQVLDRKTHPDWQGERLKLMRTMPTDTKLWEQYAEHRANGLRAGNGLKDATAFYLTNRSALDAGGEAAWAERYNADELSAIQYAMNLKLTSEEAFYSEYQNEPLTLDLDATLNVLPDQVSGKANAIKRGVVPDYATKLTAFIDVQGVCLFYLVLAVGPDFTAAVVDYGSWPDQQRANFTLREVHKTLAAATGSGAIEGQIYGGLQALTTSLLSRSWQRQTGGDAASMKISRLMVDSGWNDSVVQQFCKDSNYAALLLPSKGFGITADRKPMNEYEKRTGERSGWNWRTRVTPSRLITYDTNSWKTFLAQRLLSKIGEPGNLSLFEGTATQHRMFIDHVTSEASSPTVGLWGKVNVWRLKPNRENHYFDCLIGAAVAASDQGCLFTGHLPQTNPTKKRRKLQVTF